MAEGARKCRIEREKSDIRKFKETKKEKLEK
jgi:hypothetical protein